MRNARSLAFLILTLCLASGFPPLEVRGQLQTESGLRSDNAYLQEIYCRCHSKDWVKVSSAYEDVGRIGGWFAIRLFREALTPGRFARTKVPHKESDAIGLEPDQTALEKLPIIVKGGPLGPTPFNSEENKAKWRTWIDEHAAELQSLEPTGANIEWSPRACKKAGGRR